METLHRYPGAQPFRDDEFSRRTFFGREPASVALTDQILANRLVIVYAKSGLGKTSLLNAGVAPRLREANSLPLFVRVNDLKNGPLHSIFEGVKAEAERQKIEYNPGDTSSLWSFFKTVEFWRNDLLLTPVLILDQFEELFTLQSQEAREGFLAELGYLIRGIAPPSQPASESTTSEGPPTIRVVLSLREDFLGLLEEASDHIPEILDHRYRLAPLTYEMASKAITGPAAIETSAASTRAFRLEPGVVDLILAYLTKSTVTTRGAGGRSVEPFHLQLICQRIETIAAFKQKLSSDQVIITFQDLGGEAGLAETLENFYADAVRSLPARYLRGAVRVLCEQYLISPEGRRLSVEERELLRQLKLPRETLSQLVERRLLRTDRRSDSTYYELSHDALVQPVLASRRVQAIVVSWAAVLAGSIVCVAAAAFIVLCLYTVLFGTSNTTSSNFGLSLFAFLSLFVGAGGLAWFRSGLRRLRRYRRHTASEVAEALPTLQPLKFRILGWVLLGIGAAIMIVWGLVGFFGLVKYGTPIITHGITPKWLNWMTADLESGWPVVHDHPYLEMLWWFVEHAIVILFGYLVLRLGMRAMWPHKFRGPGGAASSRGLGYLSPGVLALVKGFFGCLGLIVAPMGLLIFRSCATTWHGDAPAWLTGMLISYRFTDSCQAFAQKPDWGALSFAFFFVSLFFVSIAWIHGAVLDARAVLGPGQAAQLEKRFRPAIATAVVSLLAIGVSLLFWAHLVSKPNRNGSISNRPATVAETNAAPGGPWTIWTVGTQAKMLESDDSGITWVTKNTSKGTFYAVNYPTRLSGWVVGSGGAVFHTSDGGANWDQQAKDMSSEDLSEVTFLGPNTGWIAGDGGKILHTEDAGATWTVENSGADTYLSFVIFVNRQSGWASGSDGVIVHTTDGGSTWKRQNTPTVRALIGMSFPTANSGWAAGRRGTILHTDDGGITWKVQPSGTRADLMSVNFVSPQSGWAVGNDGTILHTDNAGATWVAQLSGTTEELDEVNFATPQSGWAVGHKGVILHTGDGGNTWTQEKSGSDSDLMSVYVVKPYGVLGMQLENVTGGTGAQMHVVRPGTEIDMVVPNSPAEKAGLLKGDIIVALNGQPVKDTSEFISDIFVTKPGTGVTIGFIRNGREETKIAIVADGSKPFPSAAHP